MGLTAIERELAAVGISAASGCKPRINYHLKAVHEVGASKQEIKQAIDDPLNVRAAATQSMRSHALVRLGQKDQGGSVTHISDTNRAKELVSMGAAFGVNCVSSLKEHLAAAETVDISLEEVDEIMKLAVVIKEKATSHVEYLVGIGDAKDVANVAAQYRATSAG